MKSSIKGLNSSPAQLGELWSCKVVRKYRICR